MPRSCTGSWCRTAAASSEHRTPRRRRGRSCTSEVQAAGRAEEASDRVREGVELGGPPSPIDPAWNRDRLSRRSTTAFPCLAAAATAHCVRVVPYAIIVREAELQRAITSVWPRSPARSSIAAEVRRRSAAADAAAAAPPLSPASAALLAAAESSRDAAVSSPSTRCRSDSAVVPAGDSPGASCGRSSSSRCRSGSAVGPAGAAADASCGRTRPSQSPSGGASAARSSGSHGGFAGSLRCGRDGGVRSLYKVKGTLTFTSNAGEAASLMEAAEIVITAAVAEATAEQQQRAAAAAAQQLPEPKVPPPPAPMRHWGAHPDSTTATGASKRAAATGASQRRGGAVSGGALRKARRAFEWPPGERSRAAERAALGVGGVDVAVLPTWPVQRLWGALHLPGIRAAIARLEQPSEQAAGEGVRVAAPCEHLRRCMLSPSSEEACLGAAPVATSVGTAVPELTGAPRETPAAMSWAVRAAARGSAEPPPPGGPSASVGSVAVGASGIGPRGRAGLHGSLPLRWPCLSVVEGITHEDEMLYPTGSATPAPRRRARCLATARGLAAARQCRPPCLPRIDHPREGVGRRVGARAV